MKVSAPFSRNLRQLRLLSKKLNQSLKDGSFQLLTESKKRKVLTRLKNLYSSLNGVISTFRLKKVLAGAAFLLGLASSNTSTAQTFAPVVSNPFGITLDGLIPKMVDIDDDGDLDLFITEYLGTSQFFENIGTPESPAFANPIANPFGIQTTYAYFSFFDFADMDGDGDQDLLQTASTGDPIILVYQENLGTPTQPNFGEPVSNPFSITNLGIIAAPNLVDFDNDGDIDLFFGKQNYDYTHEILYYENTSIINATNDLLKESTLTFGPNPTSDFISLQSEVITKNESINLSLVNISGQVFEKHTIQSVGNQINWKANIGHLPSGHYMIRLESDGHFGVIPFEKI